MGKGYWAKVTAILEASLPTLEVLTLIQQRTPSAESHSAVNPIISDFQKGLLPSTLLHVPEKGHLVINMVAFPFHLG
jgi:hypothetical protein